MASELATQIEPLIRIASMSLKDTDSFLTTLTGVKLDYHEANDKEQARPHSAVVHRRYNICYKCCIVDFVRAVNRGLQILNWDAYGPKWKPYLLY